MAAVTICSDFGAQEKKICHCVHFFPIYLPWNDGTRYHDLCLCVWVSNQNIYFPLSPSSRGSLVPLHFLPLEWNHLSIYLRLLIFLSAILIPGCDSSNLACHMIYPECKLNKQGDNIQPCPTPFPIWNQLGIACPVLTVASWPLHRFSEDR